MTEAFAIAAVPSPGGGMVGVCRMPGRSGDLPGDVSKIAAWGAALVISMTPDDEMTAKGGGGLPSILTQSGIAWLHVPVVDYGAPEEPSRSWTDVAAAAHAVLDNGRRVLIHCAGGKGRSGMAAARLLAERGVEARAAVAAIRAVRPGAVETCEQEKWVRAGHAR